MLHIVEGINGSGKTTKALLIKESLQLHGQEVKYFHFPRYEVMPRAKELLARPNLTDYQVQRLHQMLRADLRSGETEVKRLLDKGIHCVVDRWWYSYNVYGSIRQPTMHLQSDTVPSHLKVIYYCDVDPYVAYERVMIRDGHSRWTPEQMAE